MSSTFQRLQELNGRAILYGGAVPPRRMHAVGVSIAVIMSWGLRKSLASALLYIDVSVRPSSEALFFFGHLLSRFNLPEAPLVGQAPATAVATAVSLSTSETLSKRCSSWMTSVITLLWDKLALSTPFSQKGWPRFFVAALDPDLSLIQFFLIVSVADESIKRQYGIAARR
jgi:hypothetical protein